MKILTLDPGGTTGWALFEVDTKSLRSSELDTFLRDHIQQGQIGDNSEHHRLLWSLLHRVAPDIVVCERADNRGNEFFKFMAVEYIGIVKLYVKLNPSCILVLLGADQAKGWVTNDKLLRLLILCVPATKWRHANDALRHLVYYLVFKTGKALQPVRDNILGTLKEMSHAGS